MNDPLYEAITGFMEAAKGQIRALREQNEALAGEIRTLRQEVETRSAALVVEPVAGPPGERGADGAEGRGVAGARLESGSLVLRYTDGSEENVGRVMGEKGEPGSPGPVGPQGERGAEGGQGPEGIGIAELRQVNGDLIIRTTDGLERNAGRVLGERGEPGPEGPPGKEGAEGAPSTVPGPKGERGADGAASVEEIEAIVERRVRDLETRTLADTYRGVFKAGETYQRGQTATLDGSLFLALEDTTDRPETTQAWRLITKRGRDAKR